MAIYNNKGDKLSRELNALSQLVNDTDFITTEDIPTSLPANGGNADTVDGMHARNFMLREREQINSMNDITKSGLYFANWNSESFMPTAFPYTILAIQEGWSITALAQGSNSGDKNLYSSMRYTEDNGETFKWTEWKNLNNADTVDGMHASDFAPNGFGLGTVCELVKNKDLNALRNTGFFMGSELINSPTNDNETQSAAYGKYNENGWWYIINFEHNEMFRTQIAMNLQGSNSNLLYKRVCDSGNWSKWKAVSDADTVDGKHASDFLENKGIVSDLFTVNPNGMCICEYDTNTLNTPLKAGICNSGSGVVIINNTAGAAYTTYLVMPAGTKNVFTTVSVNEQQYGSWVNLADIGSMTVNSDNTVITSRFPNGLYMESHTVELNNGDSFTRINFVNTFKNSPHIRVTWVSSNPGTFSIMSYGTTYADVYVEKSVHDKIAEITVIGELA